MKLPLSPRSATDAVVPRTPKASQLGGGLGKMAQAPIIARILPVMAEREGIQTLRVALPTTAGKPAAGLANGNLCAPYNSPQFILRIASFLQAERVTNHPLRIPDTRSLTRAGPFTPTNASRHASRCVTTVNPTSASNRLVW